ncbi:hypothetical protein Nepgr_032712 [Nepenthes gracilis]|uniref:Uncharacterized protein n=1 Tax=Nepenthes gracilis TaxID=150966 RepID=A0AAD3Y832_NEPGR|nr:hypothetical protein Nepgr_032712 [Nepenthes gracilis]
MFATRQLEFHRRKVGDLLPDQIKRSFTVKMSRKPSNIPMLKIASLPVSRLGDVRVPVQRSQVSPSVSSSLSYSSSSVLFGQSLWTFEKSIFEHELDEGIEFRPRLYAIIKTSQGWQMRASRIRQSLRKNTPAFQLCVLFHGRILLGWQTLSKFIWMGLMILPRAKLL